MVIPNNVNDCIQTALAEVTARLRDEFATIEYKPAADSVLGQAGLLDGGDIVRSYLLNGEPGEALHHLIYMVHEPGLHISERCYECIENAGMAMSMEQHLWQRLKVITVELVWKKQVVGKLNDLRPDMSLLEGKFIVAQSEAAAQFLKRVSALDERAVIRDYAKGVRASMISSGPATQRTTVVVLGFHEGNVSMLTVFGSEKENWVEMNVPE
jgi:hypothetical protein